jgi:hypothetical protein
MNDYMTNRTCPCARCRARGLMGSAVLITLGILFLIHTLTRFGFGEVFPILLIVIGVMLFLGRSASTEGHIQPIRFVAAMAPPMTPPPMTPPPPAASGNQPGSEVNR